MIGFDYNQPQNGTGSLNYWALITVRDLDGNQADVNYEIKADFSGYNVFGSSKTFNSQPTASDFAVVNTITCYKKDGGGNVIDIQPIVTGTCASNGFAGYDKIDNAQSDSTTEIFAFLPEFNAGLEGYIGQGYDSVSVRFLMGCFGGTSNKNGQGYLADSGQTTHCDGGGNADIYLLAGSPFNITVPEPGSLLLAGLALAVLAGSQRRRTH